jgi:hypothetical protein
MGSTLLRIVKSAFVVGMTSLFIVATAVADDVPKIMPADPNTIPAHAQINKTVSLILALFVLGLIVVIISSLWKIAHTLHSGDGLAGGAAGALVFCLILLGLTLNQGTGYLTGWTGFFT